MAKPYFEPKIGYAVACQGVTKRFGTNTIAVSKLNLNVNYGTLFGIIGADGSGKTTLLRMIATLLLPSEGTISLLGKDVVKDFRYLRHCIGYMPGRFSLYPDLTVRENLNVFATLYQTSVEENYDLICDIYDQLAPFAHRPAGKLSGGMKQKLALCCALVHRPRVLLLDEPTTGVDPVARKVFWDILSRLSKEESLTILVSTPYMDEAFRCDEVALMQQGAIVDAGTPQSLVDRYPQKLYAAYSADKGHLLQFLGQLPYIRSAYSFGDSIHFTYNEHELPLSEVETVLRSEGFTDISTKEILPGIEDYFLYKTDKSTKQ